MQISLDKKLTRINLLCKLIYVKNRRFKIVLCWYILPSVVRHRYASEIAVHTSGNQKDK